MGLVRLVHRRMRELQSNTNVVHGVEEASSVGSRRWNMSMREDGRGPKSVNDEISISHSPDQFSRNFKSAAGTMDA